MGNSNLNDLSDIKTYSLKQKKEDIQDIFDKFNSDNQLTAEGISNKAVTTEKLDAVAVTKEKVADSAIDSAKLAPNAVTSAKIASNAVQSSQIASNAVTSGKIGSGAITESKIANGAVTSSKLGTDVKNTLDTLSSGIEAVDKETETKLRKQVVSSLPSSTTTYNFEDGSSKFAALSKCVADTTSSSTASTNDNNNKVQKITSNSSMGSSDNARAVLDLESVTDGAKKITISFDFQFASNGRWHLSLCDLDVRETLDTVRYMNNGISLDIVSNSGNQVQVNGNSKTGTDWFGKWLTFNATIDLEHKRIESYLVSNGSDSISGSTIAFKDQEVERITGIELYTWVTNDVILIDNVNITVQGINENTLFMIPSENGSYDTYTYIDGKPILIGDGTASVEYLENKLNFIRNALTNNRRIFPFQEITDDTVRAACDVKVGDEFYIYNNSATETRVFGYGTMDITGEEGTRVMFCASEPLPISQVYLCRCTKRTTINTDDEIHCDVLSVVVKAYDAETVINEVTSINNIADKINTKADKVTKSGFVGGKNAELKGADDIGGAAIGADSWAMDGGALGKNARATLSGGAVGRNAYVGNGGAVGSDAIAGAGAAVGRNAKTMHGVALGMDAQTVDDSGNAINAIQLGTGTNSKTGTMKVYDYEVLDANGHIPPERFNNYSTTPQKVGTWIDGTPIWRVAIRYILDNEEREDLKRGEYITLPIPVNDITVSDGFVLNSQFEGRFDNWVIGLIDCGLNLCHIGANGWTAAYPDTWASANPDRIEGWVEFVTSESNIKK